MSDLSALNEVTLIDFEGIENITKFKYRTTKPKYPKPGTFYWIEETIDNLPKIGLYYAANDALNEDDLMRLDSKVYEFVIRDKDGYIQISEKDAFDKQEIYLIIGNYIKEDICYSDDSPSGKLRVFRITTKENQGLATVEGTVEYVSDSNNMLYMSNVPDYYKTGIRLGDIRTNKTREDLKNHTISEILDTIIYPTLQPEITEPSVTLSKDLINNYELIRYDTPISDILERFNSLDEIKKYITCDRGQLTYVTAEPNEEGEEYTLNYYAGKPVMESSTTNPEKGIYVKNIIPDYLDGIYELNIRVYFNSGYQPLDNKRNPARYDDLIDTCDCEDETCDFIHENHIDENGEDNNEFCKVSNGCEKCIIPAYAGGRVYSNTLSFSVVYPIFTNCITEENKHIKEIPFEYPKLINYNKDGGDIEYMEFPPEIDGYDTIIPCKMCICIPEGLKLEVYQFSEFDKSYDIKVDMSRISTSTKLGNVQYDVYSRTTNPTDTNVDSVKYKIIIKRV